MHKDDLNFSRRQFLIRGAGVLVGGALAGGIAGSIIKPGTAHADAVYLPIPSYPLDVNLVKKLAFHHYFKSGGCMPAGACSLIEAIKYALGADSSIYPPGDTGTAWDNIPTRSDKNWYKYGSGGVSGWGTLCGALNGAIAVLNLMGLQGLGDQVLYNYCQTEFPIRGLHDLFLDPTYGWDTSFAPEPIPDDEVLAYTTSESPLCHNSVSKWAYAAGVSMTELDPYGSAYKTDRCAKLSSGVAAFTAELINGATSNLTMPADTAACYACHNTGTVPAQQGKMDCSHCHTQEAVIVGKMHPRRMGMGGM